MRLLLVVLCLPFGMLTRGWALAKLWEWFAVPIGAPALGLVEAIGLALLVAFLTARISSADVEADRRKSFNEAIFSMLSMTFMFPLMIIGIGYVVHEFM